MRGAIFEAFNTVAENFVGPLYRRIGRSLYVYGTKLEGENVSEDRLVPSLRNLPYGGAQPHLESADFIAPNATILGNVDLGLNSSVWYGATLIGTEGIRVGDFSIIQDRSHVSRNVNIGSNVFIGPNVTIQGSELADGSFVSMGATVRHAKVETGGLVAAGAVIGDNVIVKEGEIWAGNPGKFLRNINPTEREVLRQHLEQMRDLALVHAEEAEKNSREVISNQPEPFQTLVFDEYMDDLFTTSQGYALPLTAKDEEFIERRTLMREHLEVPNLNTDYEPYQYNISHMGEKFNLGTHQQEYSRVANKIAAKQRFETDNNPWTKAF